MMKSPDAALYAGFEAISNAIERGQFHLAASASNNLTRLAHSLESMEDVFVGDVMSAVCGHIDYVLRSYLVSREDRDVIHATIARHTVDLVNARKEQQDVCHILQHIRYDTTSFVLDPEQRYPPRINPPAEQGGRS